MDHPLDWYSFLRGLAAGLAAWAFWVATKERFFTDYDAVTDVFEDDDERAGDVGDRYRKGTVLACPECRYSGTRHPHVSTFRRSPRSW